MADPANRVPENVPGSYYVTDECVACGVCIDTAGNHFKMVADDSTAYVCKQPGDESGKALCEEALADCPADAIGNDG